MASFQFQSPDAIDNTSITTSNTSPSSSSFAGFKGDSTFEIDYVALCKLLDTPRDWLKIEAATKTSDKRRQLIFAMIQGVKTGNLSNLMERLSSFISQGQEHRRQFDQLRMQASHVVIDNDEKIDVMES